MKMEMRVGMQSIEVLIGEADDGMLIKDSCSNAIRMMRDER